MHAYSTFWYHTYVCRVNRHKAKFLLLLLYIENMQAVLSGPSGPHCYGVTIELVCQYPRLSQSGYFSSPFWMKNGIGLAPDGNIERSITVSLSLIHI